MRRLILLCALLVGLASAQVPQENPELKQAARDASLPVLKTLYEEFAIPHDQVLLRERKTPIRVQPLSAYNQGGTNGLRGTLTLVAVDLADRVIDLSRFPARDILAHRSYEVLALERLDRFQKEQEALPALQLLAASERILAAVLQFHESERREGIRKGPEWEPVRVQLRSRLLKVRLEQLDARIRAKDWEPAVGLAKSLLDTYAASKDTEGASAEGLAAGLLQLVDRLQADAKLDDPQKVAFLERLARSLQEHQTRPIAARAVDRLKQIAREALKEANAANERILTDKERAQEHANRAQEYLTRTERIWADLEELRNFELRVNRPDSVLRIGVRDLPEFFSPALALTDNEQRVVNLVFESLVEARYDSFGVLSYAPVLAESLPVVIPQGRRFQLVRNALWSDGKPILPVDIRHSLQTIKQGKFDRTASSAGDFLQAVVVGGDARRVDITFSRGILDPLSPATFKILPSGVDPLAKAFAAKPIGSGPYTVDGLKTEQGRQMLVLRANPQYGKRGTVSGLPAIRTLHFLVTTDPLKDFERGLIDVALDVSPAQVGSPQQRQRLRLNLTHQSPGSLNRRVYFLAVNHGHSLLKSVELRRALARSLDRIEMLKLLDGEPIPGLYPPGTWAYSEGVYSNQNLFDAEFARAGLHAAIPTATSMTLKIPAGNPELQAAFAIWVKALEAYTEGKLKLEVVPVSARQLHQDIQAGNYDLAYSAFDHLDETYWLGPWYRSSSLRGENPYRFNDDAVDRLISETRDHRAFAKVKEATHSLATRLHTTMPVLPLWQLHPRHLIHDSVKPVDLDGQDIFSSLERWTLSRPGTR